MICTIGTFEAYMTNKIIIINFKLCLKMQPQYHIKSNLEYIFLQKKIKYKYKFLIY